MIDDPMDVFAAPKFNWSAYLQRHLTSPSVVVSTLHPIMGLRVAALMVDLTARGLASETPGRGTFQILSGVRTQAQQIHLYNEICLRQGRCSMVANPWGGGGYDREGVQRFGSNHQAQRQDPKWATAWGVRYVDLGYAVDIRNSGGNWGDLHRLLPKYGLDWPLKASPYEPWHLEAFPRSGASPLGWVRGPWPRRPGVHRPLFTGLLGGDVRKLQRQLRLDNADGVFGAGTRRAVRRMQRRLKLDRTGVWTAREQRRFERRRKRKSQ